MSEIRDLTLAIMDGFNDFAERLEKVFEQSTPSPERASKCKCWFINHYHSGACPALAERELGILIIGDTSPPVKVPMCVVCSTSAISHFKIITG